jgi:flagellar export protein FliJ
MKRFQFRLERLLWHRKCLEELAQQALAGALHTERELAAGLARLRVLAGAEAAMLRTTLTRPTSGAEILLHARFAADLATRRALLSKRLGEAVVAIQQRRGALMECRRAREVLAQLREKALGRYRQGLERESQLALDEIAGIRYARRLEQTS